MHILRGPNCPNTCRSVGFDESYFSRTICLPAYWDQSHSTKHVTGHSENGQSATYLDKVTILHERYLLRKHRSQNLIRFLSHIYHITPMHQPDLEEFPVQPFSPQGCQWLFKSYVTGCPCARSLFPILVDFGRMRHPCRKPTQIGFSFLDTSSSTCFRRWSCKNWQDQAGRRPVDRKPGFIPCSFRGISVERF